MSQGLRPEARGPRPRVRGGGGSEQRSCCRAEAAAAIIITAMNYYCYYYYYYYCYYYYYYYHYYCVLLSLSLLAARPGARGTLQAGGAPAVWTVARRRDAAALGHCIV